MRSIIDESSCSLLMDTDSNEDVCGNEETELNGTEEIFNRMADIEAAGGEGQSQNQRRQHCHALLLSRHEDESVQRLLCFVSLISAFYIVVQFTGGLLANSLAIIADSGHVLTDLASFLISLYMVRISARKPANKLFTFGYLRAEFVGALISLFVVWTITILMIIFATQRIMRGQMSVHADIMLLTAVFGIFFNLFMVMLLKYSKQMPSSLLHAHTHSHSVTRSQANGHMVSGPNENANIRAAMIHVFGDLIQSFGVILAALVIRFTGFELADPLCTYFFSLIVVCTSVPVARDVFLALMEAAPKHFDYSEIKRHLGSLKFVIRVHSLHIWALGTENFAASVHLVIENESKAVSVTRSATDLFQHKYAIHFSTVQIELDEPLHLECKFCTNPLT